MGDGPLQLTQSRIAIESAKIQPLWQECPMLISRRA